MSSSSRQRVFGHRVTALSRCFSDIMCTTVVVGVGTWVLSSAFSSGKALSALNVSTNGLRVFFQETMRTFDMLYDGQMTYSGSRKDCSPSSLGGSARSNDLRPLGGTDSCGWEDGRWTEWKLARIHTSDSPDSWRNLSSPPRLHEWKTLLNPSIWLFKFIFKHIYLKDKSITAWVLFWSYFYQ